MLVDEITRDEIKKIFRNRENKLKYLKRLLPDNKSSEIEKKGSSIDSQIIATWNYNESKDVIREMFKETEKYKYISKCNTLIDIAIQEWQDKQLGEFEWPFSAMNFDQHVHKLNRDNEKTEDEKDLIISRESIVFRRIKNINTLRNDYIEYLIFQNKSVIPTFGNNRGVDFYINGMPYDQKVAKSVGEEFKSKYGKNFREEAINNPALVAKSLYENQDAERFGHEPRLLIVYLDVDVNSQEIEEQLKNVDFNKPLQIDFEYKTRNSNAQQYKTECFIILLHH